MYHLITCIWDPDGRLLFCSRYAPELTEEEANDVLFWDWDSDPNHSRQLFALAKLGDTISYVVDASFPGTKGLISYRCKIQPLPGTPFVISSAQRVHPKVDTLTAREKQVFNLLPDKETAGICEELGISQSTLATTRARMKKKLGFDNNSQLIAFAAVHQSIY